MSTTTVPPQAAPANLKSRAMHDLVPGTKREPPALAPDGLPWPDGYFDRPVKQTLEEAIEMYGVRPSEYYKGRPCYLLEETLLPEYKGQLPDEPVELQELWRKQWAEWEALGRPDAFTPTE